MASIKREIAKFLSGVAAHETVGHWWLGLWGKSLLPIKVLGITFTESLNVYFMIGWPIVLCTLVYCGWTRGRGRSCGSTTGGNTPLAT